jgi:exopolysaccharide biosynthesis protein
VGVRADGTVLLLVVDGHRHGTSVGMTIEELRQVMGKLGAKDAINLDGGGSSAMVLRERLVNSPSDLDGERKIGDAVLFIEDKQAKGAR